MLLLNPTFEYGILPLIGNIKIHNALIDLKQWENHKAFGEVKGHLGDRLTAPEGLQ